MQIEPFKLERYFSKYEFTTRYLLSSSDCDGYSLNEVLQCADPGERSRWETMTLGYTEIQGSTFLRESIARQYKSVQPGHIVVLSPGEANFILMNILLKPGDHLISMAPSYQSLYQVSKSLGCQVDFWKPEGNEWYYDTGTLEGLIRPETKMLVVNFPHNPTGFIPDMNKFNKIVEIARGHNLYLYCDEMYHQMAHDEKDNIPSAIDLYEKAVIVWGMAKSFGLAGLRLGWVATKDEYLIDKILSFKDYLSMCSSPMSEQLAAIALNHKEKFIIPNLNKIKKNLAHFRSFVMEHSELLEMSYSKAGSTVFAKMNIPISTLDYSEQLVKEAGIMLLPSEMFEFGSHHIRIGLGRKNFPEALAHWGDYMRRKPIQP